MENWISVESLIQEDIEWGIKLDKCAEDLTMLSHVITSYLRKFDRYLKSSSTQWLEHFESPTAGDFCWFERLHDVVERCDDFALNDFPLVQKYMMHHPMDADSSEHDETYQTSEASETPEASEASKTSETSEASRISENSPLSDASDIYKAHADLSNQ